MFILSGDVFLFIFIGCKAAASCHGGRARCAPGSDARSSPLGPTSDR
jgi:hypothetical protein